MFNIDASFSVFISFIIFVVIFFKKIYPFVVGKIDEHIEEVKLKISEVEKLRDDANVSLKQAYLSKSEISHILSEYKQHSEEKILKIKQENEIYLDNLKKTYENSLKIQLEACLLAQKNEIIDKISKILILKLEQHAKQNQSNLQFDISKNDLLKILDK